MKGLCVTRDVNKKKGHAIPHDTHIDGLFNFDGSQFKLDRARIHSLLLGLSIISLTIIWTIDLVGAIVVPEDTQKLPEVIRGDRQLINTESRNNYAVNREISQTIPCVVSFVETYLNIQPSRIPILLPSNTTNSLAIEQLYLSALYDVKPMYVMSGQLDIKSEHITSLTALIIVEDSEQLSNTASQLIDMCGRDCKFLVATTIPFPDPETFLQESGKMVEFLWMGRIANVVFLGLIGQTVFASRSLSFQRNVTSTPSDPELVAECGEDSKWPDPEGAAGSRMYSPLKMNQCIVHVAFFEYEPYINSEEEVDDLTSCLLSSGADNDTDDSLDIDDWSTTNSTNPRIIVGKLTGIEGRVVNSLAASLNFVIAARKIEWNDDASVADEVEKALWSTEMEEVDMVLGGLPWDPENETDYTLPYESVQIVWVIPVHSRISLRGLVAPLQKDVWFAVIGLVAIASLIEIILTKNVSLLEIHSLVIGVAWPRQPELSSGRIRFISWVVFGFISTQFYLASLAGQLLASSNVQIETLRELADSSLTVGGSARTKELFLNFEDHEVDDEDDDDDEINRIMMEKFNVFGHDEYTDNFNDLINERNTSLAMAVVMNISSMRPSFEGKHVHRMREVLASYPLSFAVWRGMPYLSELDNKISNLIEGGIIGYWARMLSLEQGHYFDMELQHTDEANLRLTDLVPGFLLLVMGYGIALASLFLELVIFRCGKRNKAAKGGRTKIRRSDRSMPSKGIRKKERTTLGIVDKKVRVVRFNDEYRKPSGKHLKHVRRNDYPFEFVH